MLGRIQQGVIVNAGLSQPTIDGFASCVRYVWVLGPEDHQQFASDFPCAGQRSSIGVLTQFAVMNACAVVTDGGADIRLKRRAEGQVAPDAETQCADFSSRHLRMFGQPVQTGPAIRIEMCDRGFRGVLLPARPSGVIEGDHRSGRFDAAINFRSSRNKSIPGQPYAGA